MIAPKTCVSSDNGYTEAQAVDNGTLAGRDVSGCPVLKRQDDVRHHGATTSDHGFRSSNWVPTRRHIESVDAPELRAAHPPGINHAVLIHHPELSAVTVVVAASTESPVDAMRLVSLVDDALQHSATIDTADLQTQSSPVLPVRLTIDRARSARTTDISASLRSGQVQGVPQNVSPERGRRPAPLMQISS
jgi:hypothetical protein